MFFAAGLCALILKYHSLEKDRWNNFCRWPPLCSEGKVAQNGICFHLMQL